MHTIRLCFLFASIVGAMLQRSQRPKRFWTGFAVFGWGFLGLADIAWWARPPLLVTSHLFWWHAPSWVSTQNLQCFYENWDSIENLVMAAVGGLVGYLFGLQRDKRGMATTTSFPSNTGPVPQTTLPTRSYRGITTAAGAPQPISPSQGSAFAPSFAAFPSGIVSSSDLPQCGQNRMWSKLCFPAYEETELPPARWAADAKQELTCPATIITAPIKLRGGGDD